VTASFVWRGSLMGLYLRYSQSVCLGTSVVSGLIVLAVGACRYILGSELLMCWGLHHAVGPQRIHAHLQQPLVKACSHSIADIVAWRPCRLEDPAGECPQSSDIAHSTAEDAYHTLLHR
jgi:hypothetical protein